MDNSRMVLKIKGKEVYPLEIYGRKFLGGQKVRVLDGPLKGEVGVVAVYGIAAVATSYVKLEWLES